MSRTGFVCVVNVDMRALRSPRGYLEDESQKWSGGWGLRS